VACGAAVAELERVDDSAAAEEAELGVAVAGSDAAGAGSVIEPAGADVDDTVVPTEFTAEPLVAPRSTPNHSASPTAIDAPAPITSLSDRVILGGGLEKPPSVSALGAVAANAFLLLRLVA